MADLGGEISKLSLYETKPIVPLRTLPAGVYTQHMLAQGNSLLSTVFVESLDSGASISVRYYDYTTGETVGEVYPLATHNTISTAITSDRILVARMHDKPVVEITITGGSVRFGIYVSVVASFATDLDQALKYDQQVVQLLQDKGMPMMLYDENVGKFFFLRGDGGAIPITISESGTPVHLTGIGTTDGTAQDLIDNTVPVGKTRKINQVIVVCRGHGFYYVTADGVIIGSGRTGPASPKDIFTWNPRNIQAEGTQLKVTFQALSAIPPTDVEAYLMGSDV